MEKKISLVFHPSYYEALEDGEFTQEEKGDILDGLCRYQFYGEIPEFTNPKYKMFWKLVFPSINTSAARYKAAVENGKKGGAPKGTEPWNKGKKNEPKANQTTNLTQTQHEPKAKQDIEIENEIEKENEIENEIEMSFPTIEEFTEEELLLKELHAKFKLNKMLNEHDRFDYYELFKCLKVDGYYVDKYKIEVYGIK